MVRRARTGRRPKKPSIGLWKWPTVDARLAPPYRTSVVQLPKVIAVAAQPSLFFGRRPSGRGDRPGPAEGELQATRLEYPGRVRLAMTPSGLMIDTPGNPAVPSDDDFAALR